MSKRPYNGVSLARTDGWSRLAAGILLQAGLDARSGDRSALAWLRSDDCALFCELLEVDHHKVLRQAQRWARQRPAGGTIIIRLAFGG